MLFCFRRIALARLRLILEEQRKMTDVTKDLTAAVHALSDSVTKAVAKINDHLQTIENAVTKSDTAEVQAAVEKIRALATTLDEATNDAAAAFPQPDPAPATDPAASQENQQQG